jgi:hypothetical protein
MPRPILTDDELEWLRIERKLAAAQAAKIITAWACSASTMGDGCYYYWIHPTLHKAVQSDYGTRAEAARSAMKIVDGIVAAARR